MVGWIPTVTGLGYANFFAQVRAVNAGLPPERRSMELQFRGVEAAPAVYPRESHALQERATNSISSGECKLAKTFSTADEYNLATRDYPSRLNLWGIFHKRSSVDAQYPADSQDICSAQLGLSMNEAQRTQISEALERMLKWPGFVRRSGRTAARRADHRVSAASPNMGRVRLSFFASNSQRSDFPA